MSLRESFNLVNWSYCQWSERLGKVCGLVGLPAACVLLQCPTPHGSIRTAANAAAAAGSHGEEIPTSTAKALFVNRQSNVSWKIWWRSSNVNTLPVRLVGAQLGKRPFFWPLSHTQCNARTCWALGSAPLSKSVYFFALTFLKTISPFTPPHTLNASEEHMPLPSSLVLSRNAHYPVRMRQRCAWPRVRGEKHTFRVSSFRSWGHISPRRNSFIYFWNCQGATWIRPAREKNWVIIFSISLWQEEF